MLCYNILHNVLYKEKQMIIVQDLITGYQGKGINFPLNGKFALGSMTAIIGVNGSGKSTLIKTLAGLLPPIRGKINFNINKPRIGYLPQLHEVDRKFPLTVFDVVAMGCWPRSGMIFPKIKYNYQKNIWRELKRVGLDRLLNKTIDVLSGGQFQRMLFARLFVQQAPLILLDEPFAAIDNYYSSLLMETINELNQQGCTIIIALHDYSKITKYFSNILRLSFNKSI